MTSRRRSSTLSETQTKCDSITGGSSNIASDLESLSTLEYTSVAGAGK
jgi:hypothetical protein